MGADTFDLRGRVVVITGGLGQLGRQFSSELLRRGARIAVVDKSAISQEAPDGEIWNIRCDVTAAESLRNALRQITERWGVPYGLVNNAALDSPPNAPASDTASFETYSLETWNSVMEVNLTGTFLSCQVIGAAMARAGTGSIINISSIYGILSPDQRIYDYRKADGEPFFKPVAYSASKAAILNLTRYLATYWAKSGVRVNTLTLGGVANHQDERFVANYTARVPLERMAKPDEYNGAIVFLLSDAASYMTGSNVVLDGGWSAW
jgi:NAD(P)-dependent dehydrogenase (short-subunit alcohol dehydrogenase family)